MVAGLSPGIGSVKDAPTQIMSRGFSFYRRPGLSGAALRHAPQGCVPADKGKSTQPRHVHRDHLAGPALAPILLPAAGQIAPEPVHVAIAGGARE